METPNKAAQTKESKVTNLQSEIDTIVGNYRTRYVELTPGLTYSQYQTIRQVDFYYNSKYLTGNVDQLGREKPFMNINKAKHLVAVRATDLDVKDIQVTSDSPKSMVQAFILNHELYEWMKQTDFGEFLNDMGVARSKYGGVLAKKCYYQDEDEKDILKIDVPAWKNLVTDQIDIMGGAKIERSWMQVQDVWAKKDVWSNVKEAVELASKIRQSVTNNGINTQGNTKEVQILDIEGYFSDSMNPDTDGDSEEEYKLMHFVLATNNSEYQYLFGEELTESNYKYKAWDKVDGRALGVGVVEDGFEAQKETNWAIINQKNAMELAGKVILKTNSKKVGNNVLTDADNGRIYEMEDGKDITPINLMPNALPEFGVLITQWSGQYEKVTSTFGAVTGETKGGQAYRAIALQRNEGMEIFNYRKQEAGMFVAEIINDWVLPYLIKKINKKHILSSEYSDDELQKIDQDFAEHQATQDFIAKVIAGENVTPEEFQAMVDSNKAELNNKLGKRRFLEIPTGFFKGFEGKVSVNITGELEAKAANIDSLNNILMTVAKAPQVLQDPTLRKIFDRIIELTGAISPISLTSNSSTPQASPIDPTQMNAIPQQGGQAQGMTK